MLIIHINTVENLMYSCRGFSGEWVKGNVALRTVSNSST